MYAYAVMRNCRAIEIWNLVTYWRSNAIGSFALYLYTIVQPGLLLTLYWITRLKAFCGEERACSLKFIGGLALSLFFPVTVIMANLSVALVSLWSKNAVGEEYSSLRVMKCLHSFAESAPQIVMQVCLLMKTWTEEGLTHVLLRAQLRNSMFANSGDHWEKVACLAANFVLLAKSCAEHHHHEVGEDSGGDHVVKATNVAADSVSYLLLIAARLLGMGVLFAYFGPPAFILPATVFTVNLVLAKGILRAASPAKVLSTAVASVFAPAALTTGWAPRPRSAGLGSGSAEKSKAKFGRFYAWNNVASGLALLAAAVTLNLLSHYGHIGVATLPAPFLTFGGAADLGVGVMGVGGMVLSVLSSTLHIVVGTASLCG